MEPARGVEPPCTQYESGALPSSYAGANHLWTREASLSGLPLAGRALSWLSYGPIDGVAGTTQTCDLWFRKPAPSSLSYGDMGRWYRWEELNLRPRAYEARALAG